MYKREIRLSKETVGEFVNAANKCDFDIDICYNRVVVSIPITSFSLCQCVPIQNAFKLIIFSLIGYCQLMTQIQAENAHNGFLTKISGYDITVQTTKEIGITNKYRKGVQNV